jgi:Kef-type K+ transport system membrane component KefB/Trk K+ transport system NAD-binding subunit
MGTADALFGTVALILALAATLAALGYRFRQPLIISFLVAGVLAGPSGIGLIGGEPGGLDLLAHIGISLLLFVVGLRLDVGMIKTVGPVALATGLGQVFFTSLGGYLIAAAFGLSVVSAMYVAVALTFSSTIIIVKLLSDKKEIDSLHGRIAVGFLIVQDIVAILALIALTAFGGDAPEGRSFAAQALFIAVKGVGLLGMVYLLMRRVLPLLADYLARSQELLVLFAVTWAVALATAAERLGFSKEVGAFLAGISLASIEQRDDIAGRLTVLRDFLLLFFFIDLGARFDLGLLRGNLTPAAVLSLFVLVGNPLIVMAIMGTMGYRRRTGFMCGLAVAQISEFSLILGVLGLRLGHISPADMSLITVVGVATIFASTYMILHSGRLYAFLSPALRIFERRHPSREARDDSAAQPAGGDLTILIGLGGYGRELARNLIRRGRSVLAADFDPRAIARARREGIAAVYGDAADPEVLSQFPLARAIWVVCTVSDPSLNMAFPRLLRTAGYSGRFAAVARDPMHVERLHSSGAYIVLRPYSDAADQAADVLTGAMQAMPAFGDWPAALREITLRAGSVFAGRTIRDLPLRTDLKVTVLAVSRAGRIDFDPPPDFVLYPGDRVALLGAPEDLTSAVERLGQRVEGNRPSLPSAFVFGEVSVSDGFPSAGKKLAEARFRDRHGVSVIGIRRDEERIMSPGGQVQILTGDLLLVVGGAEQVGRLQEAVSF